MSDRCPRTGSGSLGEVKDEVPCPMEISVEDWSVSLFRIAKVVLKKGKTQLFKNGSPIVYSGAVDRIIGRPPPKTGDIVLVADGTEKPIGWGLYNSISMFCVRLMQLEEEAARIWKFGEVRRRRSFHADVAVKVGFGLGFDGSGVLDGRTAGREANPEKKPSLNNIFSHPKGLGSGVEWGKVSKGLGVGFIVFDVGYLAGTESAYFPGGCSFSAVVGNLVSPCSCCSYHGGVTVDPSCALNIEKLLETRIHAAIQSRRSLGLPSANTNAYRLVNSEGDRLSGLIIDIFGDLAVIASSAAWVEKYKPQIKACISGLDGINYISWRPSIEILKEEGLYISDSKEIYPPIPLKRVKAAASIAGRKITVIRQAGAAYDHPIDPSYPEGAYLSNILLRVL
ncbi:hypothetical protein TEA_013707 [Camellia sinensis var. sinensis]|uniref:PUA domain-containing protein n=1 Tax=Camellia sinensis var. sinensis TaxID=542762 RepID=A0A4S4DFT5_CAMSN|nr:hypothetical protein TEA_013707 [Camellia sinensis var. sinensis]